MAVQNSKSNVTLDSTCPVIESAPRFFVTATATITAPRCTIYAGEHVLIDPDKSPEPGKMVLIGSRLERWTGQSDSCGVAVSICSENMGDSPRSETSHRPKPSGSPQNNAHGG